ncbi:MAG TPA: acetoin utilization protein AcuC [Dermatophilaceae bacterium]|nr:acetoin utilization protein AcuC [Dermatophilaceae bacterium]
MPVQARLVWDQGFTEYDFGDSHPMKPVRLELTAALCAEFGLLDGPDVEVVYPAIVPDETLQTVHTADYVAAVKRASADPSAAEEGYGLGTEDDPAFEGIHEVSARIVAGTLDVTQAVWNGQARHGVNFCGGHHHAMPGYASGFCVYNDASVAIQWLLDQGVERVAYVDVDVHHGDGVERIFWDDPRVLTLSVHETGMVLFPGTGFAHDAGGAQARGSAVNLALPPGIGDADWLRSFHAVAPAVLRAFRPQFLVSQHGADTHVLDPLAHMSLSVDAQKAAAEAIHDLAHELCEGRWVALGGGGYEVVGVVPRTWTHLTAIALHRPIDLDTEVPQRWVELVRGRFGDRQQVPTRMGDGIADRGRIWYRSWEVGVDPESPVDRAVMATRQAVFPANGLDIWFG